MVGLTRQRLVVVPCSHPYEDRALQQYGPRNWSHAGRQTLVLDTPRYAQHRQSVLESKAESGLREQQEELAALTAKIRGGASRAVRTVLTHPDPDAAALGPDTPDATDAKPPVTECGRESAYNHQQVDARDYRQRRLMSEIVKALII